MGIGLGRVVHDFETGQVRVEELKTGDRIVEDGRLTAVVEKRIDEPFGGCRQNVHVRTTAGKTWCYTGGTFAYIVVDYVAYIR